MSRTELDAARPSDTQTPKAAKRTRVRHLRMPLSSSACHRSQPPRLGSEQVSGVEEGAAAGIGGVLSWHFSHRSEMTGIEEGAAAGIGGVLS